MKDSVQPDHVRNLASAADLPLDGERLNSAAELLTAWLPAANELSKKMSAPEYLELMPITVLVHQQANENRE
jgi:hypothetical protein